MGNRKRLCLLSGKLSGDMVQINPVNKALCLEWICESNYRKLLKLIPDLPNLDKTTVGRALKKPDLQLDILERSAHTLTVLLSHRFDHNRQDPLSPEVKIRVYLDAQLAEVLRDCSRADVSKVFKNPGRSHEILDYKWRLNYFLEKWLDHCLQTDYQFRINHNSALA